MRMQESIESFELAFEQEAALERRRRKQLRQRAAGKGQGSRAGGIHGQNLPQPGCAG